MCSYRSCETFVFGTLCANMTGGAHCMTRKSFVRVFHAVFLFTLVAVPWMFHGVKEKKKKKKKSIFLFLFYYFFFFKLLLNLVLTEWQYAIATASLCVVLGIFMYIMKRDNLLLHQQFDGIALYDLPDGEYIGDKTSTDDDVDDVDVDDDDDDDDDDMVVINRTTTVTTTPIVDPDALDDHLLRSAPHSSSSSIPTHSVNSASLAAPTTHAPPPPLPTTTSPRSRHLSTEMGDDVHGTTSNATNDDTSVSVTPTWSALPPFDQDHTLSHDETDEPSLSVSPQPVLIAPATTVSPATTTTNTTTTTTTTNNTVPAPGPLAFVSTPSSTFTEFQFRIAANFGVPEDSLSTIRTLFAVDSSSIEERANRSYVLRLPKANVDVMGGVQGVTATLMAISGLWNVEEVIDDWSSDETGNRARDGAAGANGAASTTAPETVAERRRRAIAQRAAATAAASAASAQAASPSFTMMQHRTIMPFGWSRAELELLFHRDFNAFDAYFSVFLAMAALGMGMSCLVFAGSWSLLLCIGTAGAVFSLLKMPSPDGGSVVLSGTESARGRAVYILLLGSVLWISDAGARALGDSSHSFWYGVRDVRRTHFGDSARRHAGTVSVFCRFSSRSACCRRARRRWRSSCSSRSTASSLARRRRRQCLVPFCRCCRARFIVGITFVIGGYGSVLPPLNHVASRRCCRRAFRAHVRQESLAQRPHAAVAGNAGAALRSCGSQCFHRPASASQEVVPSSTITTHQQRTKASGAAQVLQPSRGIKLQEQHLPPPLHRLDPRQLSGRAFECAICATCC
jgi:hypothetical protein